MKYFIFLLLSLNFAHAQQGEPQPLSIFHYKPMYFLAGNPYTKIQISVRARIIDGVPLYVGYSQLMLWKVFIDSPYFQDLNYNPDLFYRYGLRQSEDWLDFGIFEHESNGRGGEKELAWDRVYLRYHTSNHLNPLHDLTTEFKVWAPIRYNPNNDDLTRYRGLYEVILTYTNALGLEGSDLTFRLYGGGPSTLDPFQGGQELTFRAQFRSTSWLPLLVLQAFHGYAETMDQYAVEHYQVRAGIGF